jgi:hypothetical protein
MSLCKGFTQGGSNADIVLADSYLKNISDGVDWATGYEAVVADAEGTFNSFLFWCQLGALATISHSPFPVQYSRDSKCELSVAASAKFQDGGSSFLEWSEGLYCALAAAVHLIQFGTVLTCDFR